MLLLTSRVDEPNRVDGRPPEHIAAGPVVLRRVRLADAEAIADAVAESMEHLQQWLAWATPEMADAAEQRARILEADTLWETGTDFIFSLLRPVGHPDERLPSAGVLGAIGLHRRIGPGAIEMGYWVHAAHAGRGYATAAARALTCAALALPGVHRVEIHCDVANAASAAIPRKLGYRLDRVQEREPHAVAETGRCIIWVLEYPASSG